MKNAKTVVLGEIAWKKFPDGFPNIFVNDVESMKGCHLVRDQKNSYGAFILKISGVSPTASRTYS